MRISVGKLRGLQQISDATGRFTMIAMDQRGSLQKMLHPENPKAATYAEMEAVKLGVTEALAPHASGYLLDPEYGVAAAINRFALPGRTGLLVALEQSGYEKKGNWRLTTLLDGWNVEKVKRLGASAAKLLVFFNPDAPRDVVDHQVGVVRGVADECRRLDLAFVCEPMSYPVDETEEAFARHKADTIVRTAEILSARGRAVGVLWRGGEAPGPLRGLVREVLRVGPWRTSRSRSTRGGSTRTSAAYCRGSQTSSRGSGGSSLSGATPPPRRTSTERCSSNSTSG